jgi:hypothetical protein
VLAVLTYLGGLTMAARRLPHLAPGPAVLFALGSLLTLAMIAWGSAQALDRLSIAEEQVVNSYAGVTSIDLRYAHGNVDLVPARGREVEVAIDSRHGFLSGYEREDELRGGQLRLRGSCNFLTFGTCEENYRVKVPRGVAISVRTSGGEALARGLRGNLELRSNAGSVRAVDVRGTTIELRSHAGAVNVERVRATDLTLDSRAGGVERRPVRGSSRGRERGGRLGRSGVAVVAAASRRRVSRRSVTVLVPNVGYSVDAQTATGEGRPRPSLPNSRRKIRAESCAGNVSVLPLARISAPATSRERD